MGPIAPSHRPTLFAGCRPEVAAGPDGRILAVGPGARAAAGRGAQVHELRGTALPGLHDAHLHLGHLAQRELGVDLTGARSLAESLEWIRRRDRRLPVDAWLTGWGWNQDRWSQPRLPDRHDLDAVTARPVLLRRVDGHSAWASSAALAAAGIGPGSPDPPAGLIDRDGSGRPTGIVRESAVQLLERVLPAVAEADFDAALGRVLAALAGDGLTAVQSFDGGASFAALARLHAAGRLPLRVTHHLPVADLAHAERIGLRSGVGDGRLRIWGVKAFLDGSLGSRTAQMLDGTGVAVMSQAELAETARRCARAGLNLCVHAIGDAAVRRALDAFEPLAGAGPAWRPRIEHAQCVDPEDLPRFRRAGVIASMQPVHAVSDRALADREWGARAAHAYAWSALARAGAVLAFGSDAPVEPAAPLLGLDAASGWRRRAGWYPELALSRAAAIRAYSWGAAFSAGLEALTGRLARGLQCDLTVVDGGRALATVVGGRIVARGLP